LPDPVSRITPDASGTYKPAEAFCQKSRIRSFFGDAIAGERSAVIYSIIESCRRHGVEPYTYLHDVLTQLPSMTNHQIKDIVPKAWAAARKITAIRAV
jgi:hypothetical protein